MDAFGWWCVGLAVDTLTLGISIPYLGSAIGLIPLLTSAPTPPSCVLSKRADIGVFANGTVIDPNNDYWGTATMRFRVMFPATVGTYSFSVGMEAWLRHTDTLGEITRKYGVPFDTQLQFAVMG